MAGPGVTGIDAAMALAAGLGTRMRPLTDTTPKPLLPVAGRCLLDRTLDRLEEVGVRHTVVNAHYLSDQVACHVAARHAPRLTLSDESARLLETGGGVVKALPQLDAEAFFVVNTDNIWIGPRAFAPLAAGWRPGEMAALLLLVRKDQTLGHLRPGDFFMDADGRLTRRGAAESAPYVYTGAQIITNAAFEGAPKGPFSLNLIWDALLAKGAAFGVVHPGGWIDVGSPAGLEQAANAAAAWPRLAANARNMETPV
ncbi:MAG: nucleotidyltransferase family protein [Rhodobacteraceae bacterium]|nr:nucleotidyltransferase family protein [Paracoccaceae bacterium]